MNLITHHSCRLDFNGWIKKNKNDLAASKEMLLKQCPIQAFVLDIFVKERAFMDNPMPLLEKPFVYQLSNVFWDAFIKFETNSLEKN